MATRLRSREPVAPAPRTRPAAPLKSQSSSGFLALALVLASLLAIFVLANQLSPQQQEPHELVQPMGGKESKEKAFDGKAKAPFAKPEHEALVGKFVVPTGGEPPAEGVEGEHWIRQENLPKGRVIRPGTMVTMDHRPERLNIHVGEDNKVTKIAYG